MYNELNLYALFEALIKQDPVLQGRFFIAEGYGNDLNANNFDNVIKDALGSIADAKKYPVAILLPPTELITKGYEWGWSQFRLKMFFLTTTYYQDGSDIKFQNTGNNTSEHPIKWDWKDMREVAGNFRINFNDFTRKNTINAIRERQNVTDYYERVSNMGNDRVSGVSLQFDVNVFVGCKHPSYDISKIDIAGILSNIHPQHQ